MFFLLHRHDNGSPIYINFNRIMGFYPVDQSGILTTPGAFLNMEELGGMFQVEESCDAIYKMIVKFVGKS